MSADAPIDRIDCSHFRGDKPCALHKECAEGECPDRQPVTRRILVVKLGAMGDVLRTTVILQPLRERSPEAQIVWLTREASIPLLETHPLVDRIVPYSPSMRERLGEAEFDAVYCPENDPDAAGAAKSVRAKARYGVTLDPLGLPAPATSEAEEFWRLAFNDEMKFRANRKSMPYLILESLGLEPHDRPYRLRLTDSDRKRAASLLGGAGSGAPRIGFNVGVGEKFPTKAWPTDAFGALYSLIEKEGLGQVMLLGGESERAMLEMISNACPNAWVQPENLPVRAFAALIESLDALVTGDTLAAHLATAVGTPAIVLVGPTAPAELTVYGQGEILCEPPECAPCYLQRCPTEIECMRAIAPERALAALKRWVKR